MKYIRTADGRIMKHPHPNEEVFTFRYEIVKSADSIEELCDAYVLPDRKDIFNIDKHSKNIVSHYKNVYGAIWTNKGLIYVAKMNAKGELELI